MKYPCGVVENLLHMYCDGLCNDESKTVVEEHLAQCEKCSKMLDNMRDTAVEDSLQRDEAKIIKKYKQNTRKKIGIGILGIIAVTLITCFIVDLATTHSLSWFFIVLTSLMVFASVSAVPLMVPVKKGLITIAGFTVSLLILLFTCSIYTHGDWLLVTVVSVLLGLSVVFLPLVVKELPLKGFARKHKGIIVMTVDTVLLYALIIVCNFSNLGTALIITTGPLIFVWIIFAFIRYAKVNALIKGGVCTLIISLLTAFTDEFVEWALYDTWKLRILDADFSDWVTTDTLNGNVCLIILIAGGAVGMGLIAAGVIHGKAKSAKSIK